MLWQYLEPLGMLSLNLIDYKCFGRSIQCPRNWGAQCVSTEFFTRFSSQLCAKKCFSSLSRLHNCSMTLQYINYVTIIILQCLIRGRIVCANSELRMQSYTSRLPTSQHISIAFKISFTKSVFFLIFKRHWKGYGKSTEGPGHQKGPTLSTSTTADKKDFLPLAST